MGHIVMESRMEPSPCGGWIYALRNELDMGQKASGLRAVVRCSPRGMVTV